MAGTRQYVDPGYVEGGYVAGGSIVMSDLIVSNKDVTADDFRDMMANGHAPTSFPHRRAPGDDRAPCARRERGRGRDV